MKMEMEINTKNKNLYDTYYKNFVLDKCECPKAAAFTDLIKDAIVNKDYIIYNGGGPYNKNGQLYIKKFDVVVMFSWSNDPEFMVVTDDDVDFCILHSSDKRGNLIIKNF